MGRLSRAPGVHNDDDRWTYNLIRRAIFMVTVGSGLISKSQEKLFEFAENTDRVQIESSIVVEWFIGELVACRMFR
jgi:hypothetical protein